jgi:hypothetical protein
MIFEPGILDMAHKQGIKYLDDLNHDGKIDSKDLLLAKKALKSNAVTTPKAGPAMHA